MKKETKLASVIAVEPVLLVHVSDLARVKDLNALHYYLEQESRAVGEVLTNRYGGTHASVYVVDRYGVPRLTMLVCASIPRAPGNITFWAIRDTTLGTYPYMPTEDELDEMVEQVGKGKRKCNECGKWYSINKMVTYSYAGIVCKGCYNPRKHFPPDSSG